MGEAPDDYALMQAARYLGCKPWELADADPTEYWQRLALDCFAAEAAARAHHRNTNR